jgi:hypothetical protein
VTEKQPEPAGLQTAVLLIAFNRPEETRRVLAAILRARPRRLYVAVDGPRSGSSDEALVNEVRRLVATLSWDGEIRRLFRNENLGCKYGPSSAISWFFSHESEGIVLEDDCVPHPSFFEYCEWALAAYREDRSVWHINGNNFAAPGTLYRASADFVALAQVWGWATWANRWQSFEINPFYLRSSLLQEGVSSWRLSARAVRIKLDQLDQLCNGLDAWDYQWQIRILSQGGKVLSPRANLISNIGDGEDATHTPRDHRAHLPTGQFVREDGDASFNLSVNSWYEHKMALGSPIAGLRVQLKRFKAWARRSAERRVRRLLFPEDTPIVLASTGRAGSTMLAEAIVASYLENRLQYLPSAIRKRLRGLALEYANRLEEIPLLSAPIVKTHDLYTSRFEEPHPGRHCDNCRFVFVFADPLESALSAAGMAHRHGKIWLEEHIFHLAGSGGPDDVFLDDVLNYEAQILSWSGCEDGFCVHLDDIWARREALSSFLGFEVTLPARRSREEKSLPEDCNIPLFERLQGLCNGLRKRSSR